MHGGRAAGAGRPPTHRAVGNRAAAEPRTARPLPGVAYGSSWAVPERATAPGAGRSPAESTVALKVGGMQKMLTSVEGCPIPSDRPGAGEPVSVIVRTPPPAGPNAPGFRCWQSGYAAGQSVLVLQDTGPAGFGSGQAPVWSAAEPPVLVFVM